ncbi:hypothetical protein KK083_21385 [Fulvivirgaceae bacterium PWU4]|uniref:Uncharacterized protein n=1 Tax=Chryseosolibacter histidini TaxID=2782349 RepID=A0AAP2DN78_9BACT|nr:hypothetical protein [Chryseosolibacter histidini]MBT1699465.1 hypothetical protein [Chryseosolibacter histidini]
MAKSQADQFPSDAEVDQFLMLSKLMEAVYEEMKDFSKKKPDEPLNKFKVKNINRVLLQVKDMLKSQPTSQFLDLLNDESLPTNSDAILVIGQFNAAMESFRARYTNEYRRWKTKENPSAANRQ